MLSLYLFDWNICELNFITNYHILNRELDRKLNTVPKFENAIGMMYFTVFKNIYLILNRTFHTDSKMIM